MAQGIDVAEIAMQNDVERLRVISQNLANATTTGYKRDVATSTLFDPMVTNIQGALLGVKGELNVPHITTTTDQTPGSSRFTGNPLDLSIEGDAFFEVNTPQGEAYTRNGTFHLDGEGQLVTSGGFPVMGLGGPLRLTTTKPRIDQQGMIWNGSDSVGQVKLVRFANPANLIKAGSGLFFAGEMRPLDAENVARVRQGHVESSNVSSSKEMVNLMEVVQHFQMSQRVLSGYDQMLSTAISTIAKF